MSGASSATLRALKVALATAPDAQMVQIVGLVDALEDRDAESDILAPVRARLRPLRPVRPLRASRLLFTRLDAVVVDAAQWNGRAVTLPRSAIRPLFGMVAAHEPALVAEVTRMVAGATTRQTALIAQAGAILWPAAASALRTADAPPAAWRQAGLSADSFRPLARAVAGCLELAPHLDYFGDPTTSTKLIDLHLAPVLRHAQSVGALAWGMMLALLVCSAPRAELPRQMLLQQNGATVLRPAASAVFDHVWHWIEDALEGSPIDLDDAATALQARAVVLNALVAERAWRERAALLQAELRATYGRYLAQAAQERLVGLVAAMTASPHDDTMARLETEARGMRRLALKVGMLGGGAQAGAVLKAAAEAAAANGRVAAMDRARLVEILDEPDAAARLLG